MELALFLRILDDDEKISDYHKATRRSPECGQVIRTWFSHEGTETDLIAAIRSSIRSC